MSVAGSMIVVVIAAWLLILTVAWFVQLRQVGIITLQLSRQSRPGGERLLLGAPLPAQLIELSAGLPSDEAYALFLSSSCLSCKDVVRDIGQQWRDGGLSQVRERLLVLVKGADEEAAALCDQLPRNLKVIRDPAASELLREMGVPGTPYVVAMREGTVDGWARLASVDDLLNLSRSSQGHRAP